LVLREHEKVRSLLEVVIDGVKDGGNELAPRRAAHCTKVTYARLGEWLLAVGAPIQNVVTQVNQHDREVVAALGEPASQGDQVL
jgi:hypothetical protein